VYGWGGGELKDCYSCGRGIKGRARLWEGGGVDTTGGGESRRCEGLTLRWERKNGTYTTGGGLNLSRDLGHVI
jgi:hypothetical protein